MKKDKKFPAEVVRHIKGDIKTEKKEIQDDKKLLKSAGKKYK